MAIQQISLFLENRTGQLAEITNLLAQNDVDLRALSIAETSDYGIARIIADDAEKATRILLDAGHILSKNPVQVIATADRTGGLAPILTVMAENHIAIEYMYSLFTHKGSDAYMVFRVSEEEKFISLMEKIGVTVVDAEMLGIR